MTGFKATLTHMDGESVIVERKQVTWPGFKQRIRDEGMPTKNGHFGSLVITFDVDFPMGRFSKREIESLKNILGDYSSPMEPVSYNGFQGKRSPTY